MHKLWMQLDALDLESDSTSGELKCFLPLPPAAACLLRNPPSKLFIRHAYAKLADIVLSGSPVPGLALLGLADCMHMLAKLRVWSCS